MPGVWVIVGSISASTEGMIFAQNPRCDEISSCLRFEANLIVLQVESADSHLVGL